MPRRRNRRIGISLITVSAVLGIASRRYATALPEFIAAYAGDTLWALAAFFAFSVVQPRASILRVALLAIVFSFAIELSQLYHVPWIDAVRHSTLGGLILGFDFVWSDLVCYAVGVALGGVLDILINQTIGGPLEEP